MRIRPGIGSLYLLILVQFVGAFGCSATYLQTKVSDNPLDRIAEQASKDWSVERIDANTLELTNTWPLHSLGSLGYSASHANLFFDAMKYELNIQYYLQTNQLLTLWIPTYIDAESGAWGAALKPTMNKQISEILRWSGASVLSRRAVDKSEPFPANTTAPSPPN